MKFVSCVAILGLVLSVSACGNNGSNAELVAKQQAEIEKLKADAELAKAQTAKMLADIDKTKTETGELSDEARIRSSTIDADVKIAKAKADFVKGYADAVENRRNGGTPNNPPQQVKPQKSSIDVLTIIDPTEGTLAGFMNNPDINLSARFGEIAGIIRNAAGDGQLSKAELETAKSQINNTSLNQADKRSIIAVINYGFTQ
ncbi:MAG: hypothetical protein LCH83_13730 [Proteobacteria bacterium]|nr:hypothetical protein [Pseudomonadota bacterium]